MTRPHFVPLSPTKAILKAVSFAAKHHGKQTRKHTGEPYILHPLAVAQSVGTDTDVIVAALLHDVVEDCGVSLEEVRKEFGMFVSMVVRILTDVYTAKDYKHLNRAARKDLELGRWKEVKKGPPLLWWGATTIKIADMLNNAPSIRKHDPLFWGVYRKEAQSLLSVFEMGDAAKLGPAPFLFMSLADQLREELSKDAADEWDGPRASDGTPLAKPVVVPDDYHNRALVDDGVVAKTASINPDKAHGAGDGAGGEDFPAIPEEGFCKGCGLDMKWRKRPPGERPVYCGGCADRIPEIEEMARLRAENENLKKSVVELGLRSGSAAPMMQAALEQASTNMSDLLRTKSENFRLYKILLQTLGDIEMRLRKLEEREP